MQVCRPLQIKQGRWPVRSPSSLLSETGLPPLPIVSCCSRRFGFLAHGSPHEVLAWEASGCSYDTVFTKLPSGGRRSPDRVSYNGPLGCRAFPSVHNYNIWGTKGQQAQPRGVCGATLELSRRNVAGNERSRGDYRSL
ncbi:hypothetical protein CesoFtcFv8_021701 [Champsocephalus esox]|uniref:Uncharacterized protein n=1 Tax=Champsocephalus esox TaxID=159716 RepID=A0AAN8B9S1_9TELE|nr:hypothetical protein CesoFtcFv8_021701 [Champsocephalus esox]